MTAPRPGDQRLQRSQRLTRPPEFARVYGEGTKVVGRFLVLWYRPTTSGGYRLGVVASRKVGGSVVRTRCRRRLREVFRRHRSGLVGHGEVVLIARRGLADAPWDEVCEEWRRVSARLALTGSAGSPNE